MKITFELDEKTGQQFEGIAELIGEDKSSVAASLVKEYIRPFLNGDGEFKPVKARLRELWSRFDDDVMVLGKSEKYGCQCYTVWANGHYLTVPTCNVFFSEGSEGTK